MYSVAFIFLTAQDKSIFQHSEQKTFSLNGQVVNIFLPHHALEMISQVKGAFFAPYKLSLWYTLLGEHFWHL